MLLNRNNQSSRRGTTTFWSTAPYLYPIPAKRPRRRQPNAVLSIECRLPPMASGTRTQRSNFLLNSHLAKSSSHRIQEARRKEDPRAGIMSAPGLASLLISGRQQFGCRHTARRASSLLCCLLLWEWSRASLDRHVGSVSVSVRLSAPVGMGYKYGAVDQNVVVPRLELWLFLLSSKLASQE